ncbi:MAG: hypothetical protein GX489_01225 [Firmicutes bacterium]|nr:hypothetical protein [Bacillota bacterium]
MSTQPNFAQLLDMAVANNSQQYIANICTQHPQVVHWLEHLLGKSISYAVLEYKDNYPQLKNTALAIQGASSTGRLIAAEVKLSRRWQDVVALFKVLLTLTLCSPSAEVANTLAYMVPELYRHLCSTDGRMLVAIVENKPVYMDMPVFDVIVPEKTQPYINILRRCLGDSWTPTHKLVRSFNTILTQAIWLVMSFSWLFFDEHTLHLVPTRLLGAKILLCPADNSPCTTTLINTLKTSSLTPLPLSGTISAAPFNNAGVTEVTLWQRDEWLAGLLTHGNCGSSIVITSPTLDGRLSLWRLLADRSTPIASDPLVNLALKTYFAISKNNQ